MPATESEHMRDAIRANGGTVWYLMATNEGHGFKKESSVDFEFLATIVFFREYLLK